MRQDSSGSVRERLHCLVPSTPTQKIIKKEGKKSPLFLSVTMHYNSKNKTFHLVLKEAK
jgi:hypothetical protein